MFSVINVPVGEVDQAFARGQNGVIRKNGERQDHLVNFGVAVAAHGKNAVF